MSGLMDDPNRESLGLDPAWVEGTGGDPGVEVSPSDDAAPATNGLAQMTKAQLLEHAAALGVAASESMTKAEIIAAIEAG
jgi:hypothetical protein